MAATNLRDIKDRLRRNRKTISDPWSDEPGVILEWWHKRENAGDALSPVIVDWMKDELGLGGPAEPEKRVHLMALGSLIGMQDFDAVIWGSGIHCLNTARAVNDHRDYVRYDIRAVRGPVTAFLLKSAGYDCPEVYGDPAVLMPRIYRPEGKEKRCKVTLIPHIDDCGEAPEGLHVISPAEGGWQHFIDEITASEMVISSSLHGIIVAESYGVPAVYLASGTEDQRMKYYDWYFSTGRYSVRAADSVREALEAGPMPLPDLSGMQERLMAAFPADLFRRK